MRHTPTLPPAPTPGDRHPFASLLPRAAPFLLGSLVALAGAVAQAPDGPLTLEQIMAHPDWLGRAPERPYWSDDSQSVYFFRKREGEDERLLYRVAAGGGEPELLSDEAAGASADGPGAYSTDRSEKVFVRNGDVFHRQLPDGALRQLTRTQAREASPVFVGERAVAFQRDGQVFVRDLDTGLESQPFPVAAEDAPEAKRAQEAQRGGYLHEQQERLFDWIRAQEQKKTRQEDRQAELRAADSSRAPGKIYLGKGRNVLRQALAPGAQASLVVVRRGKRGGDAQRTRMPRYVTASGFTEVDEVRPKVGTGSSITDELVLLRAGEKEGLDLDLSGLPGILDDPLADLRAAAKERAKARSEAAQSSDAEPESKPGATDPAAEDPAAPSEKPAGKKKPRPVRAGAVLWSPDGTAAAVQLVSLDNKDRWIVGVDARTGEVRPLHHLHDEAWINWRYRNMTWLPDSRHLVFLSEETGFSHLYLADTQSGSTSPLTEGRFVVDSPQVDTEGRYVYFTANPEHPGHYDVFRVATAAGPHTPERQTRTGGLTAFVLSPDDSRLALLHSGSTAPPELYGLEIGSSDTPIQLTRTVSEAFASIPWVAPRSIQVPSSHADGDIYGRLYLPEGRPRKGRPAVVFVHGAGYLQNAHLGWSSYFREFMFHSLLTQRGYVVLDLDFRASAGYGRDWRTAIYRQMGTPEVQDLRDGVEWLVREHGVDPDRVGVYGGSYGGFLTFMAMFQDPDLFAAGAALRPVTDWAHYNHPYTSNILNTPELDPEAYERSSPLELVEGLRKPLLICTGMLDDNVHFQDSVRLVQRLIELEKEDWEIAIYPVERHGFVEPSSWLDEYRRILKLFETHLR